MIQLATRLTAGLALLAAIGCSVPGQVGLGALNVDVLAVTQRDAETGNVTHRTLLEWPPALNARNYEVLRKFGENNPKVLATVQQDEYVDTTVGGGQSFTYTVRALSGENKELTVSNPQTVTVLPQEVAPPAGLAPADNAVVPLGEVPTFKWQATPNATWYYVTVTNLANQSRVWSAITKDTEIKYGAESPLRFAKFAEQFPVGKVSDISQGIVYRWNVQAVRGDTADLGTVKAVDLSPSAPQTFRQGS